MGKKLATTKLGSVKVSNPSYGNALKDVSIFYEGKRPKALGKDGRISFGKNILEFLKAKFERFQWIITMNQNSIVKSYGIHRVRISLPLLKKMDSEKLERTRDIKVDIIRHEFAKLFPEHFSSKDSSVYVPGIIAKSLTEENLSKLSTEDKEAYLRVLPQFLASESIGSVNLLKAETQIKSLKELADTLDNAMQDNKSESWWQKFIKANILLIQQGYIKVIEKINVAVGKTRFPDFSLVTHDGYLDILEIKQSKTELLKLDGSHGNYYWAPEIAKAISQVENYILNITNNANAIRTFLKDEHGIEMKVVQPRGIILAGNTNKFSTQKERDDFRLLSQSLKHITIVSYDELHTRMANYIGVLEGFSEKTRPTQIARKLNKVK